jgi:hypothetical protein
LADERLTKAREEEIARQNLAARLHEEHIRHLNQEQERAIARRREAEAREAERRQKHEQFVKQAQQQLKEAQQISEAKLATMQFHEQQRLERLEQQKAVLAAQSEESKRKAAERLEITLRNQGTPSPPTAYYCVYAIV